MSAFKKSAKIISIILAAALLFAGLVFLLFRPLYYRFYPFDRITGTVRITIDGEAYDDSGIFRRETRSFQCKWISADPAGLCVIPCWLFPVSGSLRATGARCQVPGA